MADDPSEGWAVPQRVPMIAAIAIPLTLLIVLIAAGWFYRHDLAPRRHPPVTVFPAPGVETYVHDGARDPVRSVATPTPDPRIDAAKRAIVAQGWSR
jgi:hypothetical protein